MNIELLKLSLLRNWQDKQINKSSLRSVYFLKIEFFNGIAVPFCVKIIGRVKQ